MVVDGRVISGDERDVRRVRRRVEVGGFILVFGFWVGG